MEACRRTDVDVLKKLKKGTQMEKQRKMKPVVAPQKGDERVNTPFVGLAGGG